MFKYKPRQSAKSNCNLKFLFMSLVLVLIFSQSVSHKAIAQDHIAVVVHYDSDAMQKTVNILNQRSLLRYDEAKVSSILEDIKQNSGIRIDYRSLKKLANRQVTVETGEAALGVILPNGQIVVQKKEMRDKKETFSLKNSKPEPENSLPLTQAYKELALSVAHERLKDLEAPYQDRTPGFKMVQKNNKTCLLISFPVPEGTRGGDLMCTLK